MNKLTTCPTSAEIEQMLLLMDGEAEFEALAEHLNDCKACQKVAESISSQASLEHTLHWATESRAQTHLDVDEPLKRLGRILIDYEILAEIGRGGMGIVYKARQKKLNRLVAVKVLPALLGVVRPQAKARFRREAELVAGLEHTNIIGVYDYDEVDGTLFYAMQLIEGRTLRDILREITETRAADVLVGANDRPPAGLQSLGRNKASASPPIALTNGDHKAYYRTVAQWIAEVAAALHYAHGHGVIHRDIKPSNLLLAADGRLMISDFGLARPSDADTLTVSGSLMGTCRYMCPEQFDRARGAVDHQVDIYALGATLYELLAFRPMFDSDDDRQIMHDVLNREPVPPSRHCRHVPKELETICLKSVEKNRHLRYESAEAMADDLRRWLLGLPILAKRQSAAARAIKFIRRRKAQVALTVATCICLVAATYYYSANVVSRKAASIAISDAAGQHGLLKLNAARAALKREDFAEALRELDEGLVRSPDAIELSNVKAEILLRQGRRAEAAACLDRVLKHSPNDGQAHYLAGFAQSRAVACNCISIEAQSAAMSERVGDRFQDHLDRIHQLMPGSAQEYTLQACNENDDAHAIKLFQKALAKQPDFGDAMILRANRHADLGNFEAMLADAETAAAIPYGGGLVHGIRAVALYHLNRFVEADDACTEAIHRDLNNVHWWYDRSLCRSQQRKFQDALNDAEQALRIDAGYSFAYVAKAKALKGLKQPDEAMTALNRASELNPQLTDVYAERSELNLQTNRNSAALHDADRLVELDPSDIRGYRHRGLAQLRLLNFDAALVDMNHSVRLSPDEEAFRLRGVIHFFSGKDEAAVADFGRAAELQPSMAANHEYRGRALVRLNRVQEAILDFTRWIDLNDQAEIALMRRGMVYDLLDESTLALADYDAAGERHPVVAGYARLWKYVRLKLDGRDIPAGEVLMRSPTSDPKAWLSRLFSYFKNELTAEQLMAAAESDDQRAEAHYYIGTKALVENDKTAAHNAFARCIAYSNSTVLEVDFARARIARMRAASESN